MVTCVYNLSCHYDKQKDVSSFFPFCHHYCGGHAMVIEGPYGQDSHQGLFQCVQEAI